MTYLEMVNKARVKKLKLVEEVKKELTTVYLDAFNSINIPSNNTNIWAALYKAELQRELKKLDPQVYETIKNASDQSAILGIGPEWELFSKALGDTRFDIFATLTEIPDQVVRELITGELYKDGIGLSDRIWKSHQRLEKSIDTVIQSGIVAKKSVKELAEDLYKYVNEDTNVAFNAFRLASTSITHAYQLSTIRAAEANPLSKGIKWHSVLQGRTCQICRERHGKVFKINEVPLDHPLGLCTTYSYIPQSFSEVVDEIKKMYPVPTKPDPTPKPEPKSEKPRKTKPKIKSTNPAVNSGPTAPNLESIKNKLLEIGFKNVKIGKELTNLELVALNIDRLDRLDKKFGGIIKKHKMFFSSQDKNIDKNIDAYVTTKVVNNKNVGLVINPKSYNESIAMLEGLQSYASNDMNFNMPALRSEYIYYTLTHEYGHIIHNEIIYRQSKKWDARPGQDILEEMRQDIISRAEKIDPYFDLDYDLSGYGKTNSAEFFAEVFANSQLGSPNALGLAMLDFLEEKF